MNCNCNQGRLECSCASDLEGSAAQKAYWAGFEAATMRPGQSNIRAAWNEYRLTDEFKRINPPDECVAVPEECPHMIVFDDTDRENLMFAGAGAREAALKTWEKISGSWNAHLFVRVDRNCRDDRYPSAMIAQQGKESGDE